ncbi:MAG: class I SAM-dependent methyltransferase [Deltaproteobacteria bacterium]|nr:class I SAM-dependent methyltransferase [Deltaproteobacteria bacterium]
MNILEHNRVAWNQHVKNGNEWTIPVTSQAIGAAARGDFQIVLTPKKPIPQDWLGDIAQAHILCLASGGGQQGPLLAAAGASVTVFDNSDAQLQRDADLSEQFHLGITTVQGNMQDLQCFSEKSFDMIIHPVSNCFIDDILPVWRECYRVLKEGGRLLSGFCNPISYMIDWDEADSTQMCVLKHAIPYSDLHALSPERKQQYRQEHNPFEFGHSLSDQIQGQIGVGFVLTGFYEDTGNEVLDRFTDRFIATRAVKLPHKTLEALKYSTGE